MPESFTQPPFPHGQSPLGGSYSAVPSQPLPGQRESGQRELGGDAGAEGPSSDPSPVPPRPSARLRQSLVFNFVVPSLVLVAAVVIVVMLGSVEPQQRPPTDDTRTGRLRALPPVRVELLQSLESTGQQLQLEVDGSVVPYREARLAAEVAGRVIFKADICEAGSYVTANELLMRIDATDYELEVQRLSRLQEQEYQALGEVDQEMVNSQRLIDVAKQDVNLQQKEVDRLRGLPKGFASPAEIDQANRALLAATQQLVNAENQLDLLRKRRVRLEASERLAATQLKAAEVNLRRTEIRAPIDGVIVSEDADLNTFVARGDTLVTIEDTSRVEVATNLRMDQLYWVLDQRGEKLDPMVRGYNLPETPAIIEYELSGRDDAIYRWKGRLLRYDGIGLDPVSRTVPVRVVVDNPTQYVDDRGESKPISGSTALVRGMFVRVKLLIQPQTPLVVIPARALQPGNRVLQFVPDESVLGALTFTGREAGADSIVEAQPTSGGGSFDPADWEPGRVYVRRAVNPVDSLSLAGDDDSLGDNSAFATSGKRWVCEARDPSLQSGSFVVVSPLGSMADEAVAVRAERKGMTPPEMRDPDNLSKTPTPIPPPSPADPNSRSPADREDA